METKETYTLVFLQYLLPDSCSVLALLQMERSFFFLACISAISLEHKILLF